MTWGQAVDQFLDAHERTWRNAKHRQQWRNTLTSYASPFLGNFAVASIGTPEVIKVLDAIWHEKPETASRVRGRIERVLDWAKVRGYREGENPARWRGHLDKVFPTRSKIRRVEHHPAVCNRRCASNLRPAQRSDGYGRPRPSVCNSDGWSSWRNPRRALVRNRPCKKQSGPFQVARMKTGHAHRVTLSREALAVLKEAAKYRVNDRVFPSSRRGRPISSSSLINALQAAGGGRRDGAWLPFDLPRLVQRTHVVPRETSRKWPWHIPSENKVEAAYRRGELLEARS